MASMPWVKLYTEMLDDPKMAEINPIHKWFFVQLILLAGECDQEGLIPLTVKQIAWRLREASGDLEAMLYTLQEAGLVTYSKDDVFVVSFSKRQDRPQSVKREQWNDAQRRHRSKPESVIHDTSMTNTDVILVEERRGDKSRGEEEENHLPPPTAYLDPPTTPKEAMTHPEIIIFQKASKAWPGRSDYKFVIDSVQLLRPRYETEDACIEDLARYAMAWQNPNRKTKDGKPYKLSNPGWLEWAINKSIPPIGGNGRPEDKAPGDKLKWASDVKYE